MLPYLPKTYGRYFEPFVGGGALFFNLQPKQAVLSDWNLRLVRTYRGIRDNVFDVITRLSAMKLEHVARGREFFNEVRAQQVDSFTSDAKVAAWFIYLNKAGFNGLYRVNKSGQFNVPFGKNPNAGICDSENLQACALALKGVEIFHRDFGAVLADACEGDFVYFDSPYIPLTATSSFTSYTSDGFDMKDQVRLRDVALELKRRGVHVLLSNSSAPAVAELYTGCGLVEVSATRSVNSKVLGRGAIKELLISLDHPGLTVKVSLQNEVAVEVRAVDDDESEIDVEAESEVEVVVERCRERLTKQNEPELEPGDYDMGYMPEGWGADIAKADAIVRGERSRDGDYIFLIKNVKYEKTKSGPALIVEMRVVESKKIVETVEPNAVGADVPYFMPDYGDAAVMLKPNFKLFACGLCGYSDPKKVDQVELGKTIDLIGGPRQIARGMYIRGVTFHTSKKDDSDFMGFNWHAVPGENNPSFPSVMKRRAEMDAADSVGTVSMANGNGAQNGTNGSTNGNGAQSAPPSLPGAAPSLPATAGGITRESLLAAGWAQHPGDPKFMWKGSDLKLESDLLAGR